MNLHQLAANPGSRKEKNRLGRGIGSGNGKTSGKGHKGQNARSGGGVRPGFEGGQNPVYRRLRKRGFNNYNFQVATAIVNLSDLERFDDGATVDQLTLREAGLIGSETRVKVLGNGTLTKKLTVKVDCYSKSAEQAIIACGGTAEGEQ